MEKKKNTAVDRISDLPDEILHHILSFGLTTKEVVQTRLLSRRWRYVWKSVPVLNFDNSLFHSTLKFNYFVDCILLGLVDLNIVKFQLCMEWLCDAQNLKNWLNIALKHRVREVHLQFRKQEPVKLPRFRFPITQLITLQLENVELPHGKSNGHSSLNLPNLENLVLIKCPQNHLKVFDISCIRLKNLVIDNCSQSIRHCKIKISTPNLISFKCIGGMYEDYILVNLSSLASVEFGFFADGGNNRHKSQCSTNALRGFCNATSLQLSPVWFEPTLESRRMLNLLDPFFYLKYLNMASNSSGGIHALAIILKNSPQLKRAILYLFEANDKPEEEDWNEELMPFNLMTSITTSKLLRFRTANVRRMNSKL